MPKAKARPSVIADPKIKLPYTALVDFPFDRVAYKAGDKLELVPRQAQYLINQSKIKREA